MLLLAEQPHQLQARRQAEEELRLTLCRNEALNCENERITQRMQRAEVHAATLECDLAAARAKDDALEAELLAAKKRIAELEAKVEIFNGRDQDASTTCEDEVPPRRSGLLSWFVW